MPGAELPSGTYDAGTTLAPRSQLSNVGPYRLGSKFSRRNYPRGGLLAWYPPLGLGPRCHILPA
jgi:hypothetical protein